MRALGIISPDKYYMLKALVTNSVKVEPKKRNTGQKKAVYLYRRWKNHLGINCQRRLTFDGKIVVKSCEVKELILNEFQKQHGSGVRTLYSKLNKTYHGITRHTVEKVLSESECYHRHFPRFLNKLPPKTIKAVRAGERWQVDLIEMRKDSVCSGGKSYNYILQIIDVYSRFLISRPLPNKSSKTVAGALQDVIHQHDSPTYIQCDNGSEFKGEFKMLCRRYSIKILNSSPYHPQSQGKCERSNRTLKNKIRFATASKNGFNWVEGLPEIIHAINKTPKRILGNRTPLDIYFSRGDCAFGNTSKHLQKLAKMEHDVIISKASGKISSYRIGENVLLKYPFKKCRVPTKRYILVGKVMDRKGYHYSVKFQRPHGNTTVEWVRVDNITSSTLKGELQKQKMTDSTIKSRHTASNQQTNKFVKNEKLKRKKHREKYYLVLNHDDYIGSLESFGTSRVRVILDPVPDGNCQFEAVSHQLGRIGILTNASNLREQAVDHLARHKDVYEPFVVGTYEDYIEHMRKDGSYGDHLTLLALTRELNIQCLVLSTSPTGLDHPTLVSNDGIFYPDMNTISLGHFSEDRGLHYVSIALDTRSCLDFIQTDTEPTQNVCVEEVTPIQKLKAQVDIKRHKEKILLRNQNSITEILPREMIYNICKLSINAHPETRFTLGKVNNYFKDIVNSINIPKPELYIRRSLLENTALEATSVRKLIRRAGRGSGLCIELRKIITNRNWMNAWLSLRPLLNDWFVIEDIWYRNRLRK